MALCPADPRGYLDFGEVCLQKGLYQEAIQGYEEALQLDPVSVMGLERMGVCCFELGERKRARACWRRALELDPSLVRLEDMLRMAGDRAEDLP